MDATDPENRDTAAEEWQPEDSFASSSPFPVEQNGSESPSSKDEEGYDRLSECQDSQSAPSSPASQTHFSPANTLHRTSLDNMKQNALHEDEKVSDYSDEEEDSEEEDMDEDEMEEELKDDNNKVEAEKSVSAAVSLPEGKDEESKKSSFSLYSGVSDIISGSCSSPSSNSSTPSLTSNKTSTTPSAGLQNLSGLVNKSGGGGLLVHHPVTPKKRVVTKTKTDHLSDELNLGYRILMELMSDYQKGSNTPFMEAIEMNSEKNKDYLEVVKRPLWLKKIKEDLLAGKYTVITDLIGDLRTMLENAYRYYGPANSISKKGLRLEHMIEQKIALLPKEVRDLCSLEKTSGQPPEDITEKHRNKTAKISVNGDNFFSYVMYRVRGCRVQRDKELKKRKMEAMRQAKRDREQEIIEWEKMLMKEPSGTHMRAMWELPQIGHFIFLTLKTLNIYEVPQYEVERMLLMPRASRTLAMLLTSLLSSPQQRQKLSEKPYMPYKVWVRKLAHKTLLWYRCYYRENRNAQKVFDQMGIEPQFWLVCGPTNPFDHQLFHEMTYHQRVWLLKSLCDFLLNNHKTVQEMMAEQTEADQREYYLGQDREGNDYLHFPQFCGQNLRIYRRARVPSPEVKVQTEEVVEGSILPMEKVKEHRKMMRKYRHKYEEEAEWEGTRGKKRKRKRGRGRGRAVDPEEEVGISCRSRPVNLRQQPRARYNDDLEDLGLSSDDEPKPKPKRKCAVISDSSGESDQEEATEKPEEGGAAVEEGEEDEVAASNSPMPPQLENLSRAQQKNPRTRRGGKKKPTCELCGKTFQNIAALKGHRAVHTKEKQKLALNGEDIPVTNKKLTLNEESRETSEERTYNGADRAVSEEGSVTQNGDCVPELKRQLEKTSVKENDLKSESLVNGTVKDEEIENGNLKDVKAKEELENMVKLEIKTENEVKEEKWDDEKENNVTKEKSAILGLENEWDDAVKKEEDVNTKCNEDKTKDKSPSPPKDLPIHDPSPYLPSLDMFELVVTSVEQLRALVQRFGDLPEGMGTSTSTNTTVDTEAAGEEEKSCPKKAKEDGKKRPSCEVKLHSALCNLLKELSPWETKLLTATKRLRTKMKHEWNDYEKRDVNYVDPAEEAWMSDPEPEPEPPTPIEQESSSSSSSSEESLDEEGNPKRKLRKRKAKRQAVAQLMETTAPQIETPSLAQEENADGYAVSSRGRVRKVKKMVNYDGLDFDKLAMQASEEAEIERARKRKKREEDEKEKEENEPVEERSTTQPSGVRRYLLSQAGHVMGYIDNKGQVHSGAGGKLATADRSVQNLASQLVTANKKESTATPTKPEMTYAKKSFQHINVKPDVPTVVVAAINDHGSPVYVRVVGEQALQLVKYMRPSIKGRVSQIKLQHHGQTYTVNTNAHMITNNIPGLPDGEATVKPASSVATPTSTSNMTTAKPLTNLQSLATNNSPSVPRVAPISSVVSGVSSPNTLALAYRGVAKQARPTTVNAPVRPQAAPVPKAIVQQDPNRVTSVAHTRLVSASPSVVSSVVPPTIRTQANIGSSPTKHGNLIAINQSGNRQALPTIVAPARPQVTQVVNRIGLPASVLQSEGSPVRQTNAQQQVVAVQSSASVAVAPTQPLGQTVTATPVAVPGPGGQTQVQLKLESESLAQLMQRTGSKIVALPNGRGGYTLSLTPGAVQPGQKSQTQIAANTAAKVQVVSGANALLEDTPQTQDVQQQSPVVQQQSHVISQGIAQPAVVSQQTSLTQQIGVKQVVPASQVNVSGSGQVVSRVGVQQRVFGNLVSSPQGTRTTQVPVTAVIASHQQGGQATGMLQKVTSPQSQLTGAQTGQHQIVLQQRVAATGTQAAVSPQVSQGVVQQPAAQYKQVVVNQPVQQVAQQVAQGSVLQQQQQQVVRLHPVSGSGGQRNIPTQKLVQIVQPGGGRQVVQMVQQVVGSQGQASQGHQQLIYVQGNGQVIQQQPAKANIGSVQHTLQGTTTLQQGQVQQIVGQQNLGEQKLQQIVNQQQIIQQQTSGQSQQHIVQQKQVAQTQVVQQQTQPVMQQQLVVQQPQQQQQMVQQQQQQVVQQQQQQQVVQQQVVQQQQQQQQVVQQQQQQQQQVIQQQVVQQQQHQQQQVVQQQQQQTVVQQQQTVVQQQPVVQQQQVVQQQGRLVLVRTSQGDQMALQLPDGRVSLLTQEQLQAAINNGSIKISQQN